MMNPVFYNREDQWEVPTFEANGTAAPMEPYYTIMKLPGETGAEHPDAAVHPRQKDNLAAWMVARSDGANYGKLAVFQFPSKPSSSARGRSRINQDQVISPQITLWNQQGSEVIQGTLLVIPIESLIYIRPLYLRAPDGEIPALTRVIVGCQNQIVMEAALPEALERLFPAAAGPRRRRRHGAGPARPAAVRLRPGGDR